MIDDLNVPDDEDEDLVELVLGRIAEMRKDGKMVVILRINWDGDDVFEPLDENLPKLVITGELLERLKRGS